MQNVLAIFFTESSSSNKLFNNKGIQQKCHVESAGPYNTKRSVKKWMVRKRCIVTLTWHSFLETANLTGRSREQQHLSRPLDMNDWKSQWSNPCKLDYLINLRWKTIFHHIFRALTLLCQWPDISNTFTSHFTIF